MAGACRFQSSPWDAAFLSPLLSLPSPDDRDLLQFFFLAWLFCAPNQSAPVTTLRVFPDRTTLTTERLVTNPPPRLEHTPRTPLEFFIRLARIFLPLFPPLQLSRLSSPFKRSDSPPPLWLSGSWEPPTAVTYLVRGRLSQAQTDSARLSVRPLLPPQSTLTSQRLVQTRNQVCVFMCTSVRVGMCTLWIRAAAEPALIVVCFC